MKRFAARVAAGALVLMASLVVMPAAQASAALIDDPVSYVALGDSYAAGFGLTPLADGSIGGCQQAADNYPHQLAEKFGYALTDVTCTGAVTANIIDTPQITPSYFGGGGTAPVQSDALSADTDIVTVSIGGNDAGFGKIAVSCFAETENGPVAGPDDTFTSPTCEQLYVVNGVDTLAVNITTVVADNLAATFQKITAAAPNARIVVVGYPTIMPDAANTPQGGCFTNAIPANGNPPFPVNAVPFTATDVEYLHSVEVVLNQTIAAQAQAAGFVYVDNAVASEAHSICPQSADPYVNGITLTEAQSFTVPGALHPNQAGVDFLAAQAAPAVAPIAPTPAPVPAVIPRVTQPITPTLASTGFETAPVLIVMAVLLAIGTAVTAFASRRIRDER